MEVSNDSFTAEKKASLLVRAMIQGKKNFPRLLLEQIKQLYGYSCSIFVPMMAEAIYREPCGRWAHTANFIGLNLQMADIQNFRVLLKDDMFSPARLPAELRKKSVLTIRDLLTYEEYEKTENYRFAKSLGFYYFAYLVLKDENMRSVAGIGLFRTKEEGDFSEEEISALSLPLPEISALYLMKVEHTESVITHSLLNCCSSLLAGVVMTDNRGMIIWSNAAAQKIGRDLFGSQQNNTTISDLSNFDENSQELQQIILNREELLLQRAPVKCAFPTESRYCFYSTPFIVRNIMGNSETRYLIMIHKQDEPVVNQNREVEALSNRELQILDCILLGKTNSEIAETLHISENTVRVHTTGIYRKLGVKNKAELIIMFKG